MPATRFFTGNLKTLAPNAPFNGVWVRLVSNADGKTYVSGSTSSAAGDFSVSGVPTGSYQIQTSDPAKGGSSSGPWTSSAQSSPTDPNVENTFRPSLTPAAVSANTSAEQTFNVPGLVVGDVVVVNPPSLVAGLVIGHSRVSAADTLAIAWGNLTAGNLTPPSGTYLVAAIRT